MPTRIPTEPIHATAIPHRSAQTCQPGIAATRAISRDLGVSALAVGGLAAGAAVGGVGAAEAEARTAVSLCGAEAGG